MGQNGINITAQQLKLPITGIWENLDLPSLQRFSALKSDLYKNMGEFLKKLNLFSESVIEIKEVDEEFVIERQEIKQTNHEKYTKGIPELMLLNRSVQDLRVNLITYQEVAYYKHEFFDVYVQNKDTFNQETDKLIRDFATQNYRNITALAEYHLEKFNRECLQSFKKDLLLDEALEKNPNVATYVERYKFYKSHYVSIFDDEVKKTFEGGLSEVFVSPYRKKLYHYIKEAVIDNKLFKELLRKRSVFVNDIYQELDKMFLNYFVEGEISELFDIKVLRNTNNIVNLFKIILLTDYRQKDDVKNQTYFATLQKIYFMFMESYIEGYPELLEYLGMAIIEDRDPEIQRRMNEALQENVKTWSKEIKDQENLFALMSVFLAFNFITEESLDISYNCQIRYMLKCVFRNLKNGEAKFTNFQILCCIESIVMEYATSLDNSQIKMNNSGSLMIKDLQEKIRNTSVKSIAEHLEHEGQLEKLSSKLDPNLVRPEKFFFEKISDSRLRSKSVIICVSGFISEDYAKHGEWKDVCLAFPDTEVIAVNWKSNALTSIGGNMWSSFKEKFKEGINLSSFWKGGMAIYRTGREAWSKTYEQAVLSGRYLAHFLAETDLFKGHVINLMGFSLGTLVIMSCIYELEKMNRSDVVYDVLLMGGVAHIEHFHRSILKAVGHKLINCYCSTDYILYYLLSHVHENANPVGLGPITWDDDKVVNLDVTHISNGHIKYRSVLGDILTRTDFNEDLEYMLK